MAGLRITGKKARPEAGKCQEAGVLLSALKERPDTESERVEPDETRGVGLAIHLVLLEGGVVGAIERAG